MIQRFLVQRLQAIKNLLWVLGRKHDQFSDPMREGDNNFVSWNPLLNR